MLREIVGLAAYRFIIEEFQESGKRRKETKLLVVRSIVISQIKVAIGRFQRIVSVQGNIYILVFILLDFCPGSASRLPGTEHSITLEWLGVAHHNCV